MHRLTRLGWAAMLVLILIVVAVLLLLNRCASDKTPAPVPTPVAAAALPVESVGAAVQDVRTAMMLWKDFTESSKNHPTQAERDRVAAALRAYIAARPAEKVLSSDASPASAALVHASRDLVVAVADAMERR